MRKQPGIIIYTILIMESYWFPTDMRGGKLIRKGGLNEFTQNS